jgi:hypothetical protein
VNRKAAAFVTFAAVLLTLATMSTVVAPPRGGVAIRAATPDPPAVGSCGDLNGSEFVVADCSETHTVEVAYAWSAGDTAAGPRPTFAVCADKVRAYVGSAPAQDTVAHPAGRWSLPLRYRHIVATGPDGNNVRDWSWQVCLVVPMGPAPWTGYRGQVHDLPTTGPAAAALRVCYTNPGSVNTVVPCTSPHHGEILATQPLFKNLRVVVGSSGSNQPTSCIKTARATTGADDPTFHGQLRVAVLSDGNGQVSHPFSADIGVYYTSTGLSWLVCVVETIGDRRLLGSVAGVGDAGLPFG